jgi:hypothetical protein
MEGGLRGAFFYTFLLISGLHLDILFFSFLLDISFRSEELMVFFVFWRGWGYGCCRYGLSLKRSMGASHEHVKIR